MRKTGFALLICFSVIFLCPVFCYGENVKAESEQMFWEQFDQLDFSEIQTVLNNESEQSFSFGELVKSIITGDLKLSPEGLLNSFLSLLFKEIKENAGLLRNLLVICALCALLKNLTNSFDKNAASELGFYVCYIIVIMVLFNALFSALSYTKDLIQTLAGFMQASIPLLMTLIIMSGTVGAPLLYNPTMIFAVNIITFFINGFLTQLIVCGAAINIINYISEKEILKNFSELIKTVCDWSLKIIAFLFVSILTLQKITAPIMQNLVTKSAKAAIKAVPVLGDVINGAWDMVFVWAGAIKSGIMVAFVVAVVLICAFPVIKLLTLIFIFKITAALIQPISDERITKCINTIADYIFLLLGCLVTVVIMFILSVLILLSF